MNARWIRLGALEPHAFHAACARLAGAQARRAPPVLLWARAEAQYLFALAAPRRLAPGRAARWLSWGLAPAIATYRQFGVPAYLDRGAIWLHGREIAPATAQAVGECALVASSFLLRFPQHCAETPSSELEQAFRLRLEAQHGWQFDHSWPSAPERTHYAVA